MKRIASVTLVVLLAFATLSPLRAEQEPGMIDTMRAMQYFMHKLALSVASGNQELADFYAHELEENIENAQQIEDYHGQPIAELTTSMLVPAFESLEAALDGGDREQMDSQLEALIGTCNACHKATGYDFIHIAPADGNPYMQSFEPRE